MPDLYDKLTAARYDMETADRAMKAVIAAPGVSLQSERAKTARKKLKESKAAFKEAKKAFDAHIAEENKKTAEYLKRLDESLGKAKKSGKTKKARGGKSRSTRRRV
jgi:hypothetical protein